MDSAGCFCLIVGLAAPSAEPFSRGGDMHGGMPRRTCHARDCDCRPAHEYRLDGRETAARLCAHHDERVRDYYAVDLATRACPVCGEQFTAAEIKLRQGDTRAVYHHGDRGICREEVTREPGTVHLDDYRPLRAFNAHRARLCHYCPHMDCPGASSADDRAACSTLSWWLAGKIDLAQAVQAKRGQQQRHERTDEFRDWVFHQVTDANGVTLDEAETDRDYEKRRDAGEFAAVVAKGTDARKAKREMEQELWVHIPGPLCGRIEEKREELVVEN